MPALQEHPALQDFNPTREKTKFALGKILKWAAIGAVVGGVGLAAASGIMTATMGWFGATSAVALVAAGLGAAVGIPVVGWVLGGALATAGIGIAAASFFGLTSGAFLAAGVTGLMWGAGIGAVVGAIRGISGAQEAVEEKRDDLRMDHERALQYNELAQQMQMKRTQQWVEMQKQAQALGLAPQPGLPQGLGMEGRTV